MDIDGLRIHIIGIVEIVKISKKLQLVLLREILSGR